MLNSASAYTTRRFQHSQEHHMTHDGNVSVPRDLDLCPFNPRINGFLGLTLEHCFVKFGDVIVAASVFEISCGKRDRQTDRQTHNDAKPYTRGCRWRG